MTSKELSDLSEKTITAIKDASFEEAHFSVALAQAYATLAIAAAQRELNEMLVNEYGGASIWTSKR